MKKIIILVAFALLACKQSKEKKKNVARTFEKEKTLKELMFKDNGTWSNGVIEIVFHEEKIDCIYHGQCPRLVRASRSFLHSI